MCYAKSLSHVRLCATPWTVARQAPLSIGVSRQEYWSGLPFPSPGDLPNPGIEPQSPTLQADVLTSEPPGKPKGLVPLCFAHARTHARTHTQSCPRLCDPVEEFCRPDRSFLPSAADLPNAGIELGSPAFQANPLPTELSGKPQLLCISMTSDKPLSLTKTLPLSLAFPLFSQEFILQVSAQPHMCCEGFLQTRPKSPYLLILCCVLYFHKHLTP